MKDMEVAEHRFSSGMKRDHDQLASACGRASFRQLKYGRKRLGKITDNFQNSDTCT